MLHAAQQWLRIVPLDNDFAVKKALKTVSTFVDITPGPTKRLEAKNLLLAFECVQTTETKEGTFIGRTERGLQISVGLWTLGNLRDRYGVWFGVMKNNEASSFPGKCDYHSSITNYFEVYRYDPRCSTKDYLMLHIISNIPGYENTTLHQIQNGELNCGFIMATAKRLDDPRKRIDDYFDELKKIDIINTIEYNISCCIEYNISSHNDDHHYGDGKTIYLRNLKIIPTPTICTKIIEFPTSFKINFSKNLNQMENDSVEIFIENDIHRCRVFYYRCDNYIGCTSDKLIYKHQPSALVKINNNLYSDIGPHQFAVYHYPKRESRKGLESFQLENYCRLIVFSGRGGMEYARFKSKI